MTVILFSTGVHTCCVTSMLVSFLLAYHSLMVPSRAIGGDLACPLRSRAVSILFSMGIHVRLIFIVSSFLFTIFGMCRCLLNVLLMLTYLGGLNNSLLHVLPPCC